MIAAEGTLKKGLYQNILSELDIELTVPDVSEWIEIRYFIESVKQGNVDTEALERFCKFIEDRKTNNIILGCTEFSFLADECKKIFPAKK